MSRPVFTVLMNTTSGSFTDEAREKIAAAFARTGLEAQIIAATGAAIQGAAERAASAGGDGTVSTGAAGAVKSGATFGVIPLGTLNHFARDAGMPADVDAAVATLA